jgi:hypothetical protein
MKRNWFHISILALLGHALVIGMIWFLLPIIEVAPAVGEAYGRAVRKAIEKAAGIDKPITDSEAQQLSGPTTQPDPSPIDNTPRGMFATTPLFKQPAFDADVFSVNARMQQQLTVLGQLIVLSVQAHPPGAAKGPHPAGPTPQVGSFAVDWQRAGFLLDSLRDRAIAQYLDCQGLIKGCVPAHLQSAECLSAVEFAIARILWRMSRGGVLGVDAKARVKLPAALYMAIRAFDAAIHTHREVAAAASQVCTLFEPFMARNWHDLYSMTINRSDIRSL